MPGPGLFDSSDDDNFVVGPTLDQRVIDGVMEKILTERVNWELYLREIMNNDREKADKKMQKMMKVIVMLAIAFFVMSIAFGCLGYVLYNKPVTIVVNVEPAAAGQCPFEDDFEEPDSGQTQVTEHYVFQDTFQQAYALVVSAMKAKNLVPPVIYGSFAIGIYSVAMLFVIGSQGSTPWYPYLM